MRAKLDWPLRRKVEVSFSLADSDEKLNIFTTRPDTLFGMTYIALAPQHPLAQTSG